MAVELEEARRRTDDLRKRLRGGSTALRDFMVAVANERAVAKRLVAELERLSAIEEAVEHRHTALLRSVVEAWEAGTGTASYNALMAAKAALEEHG